jgi:hypothetical protein
MPISDMRADDFSAITGIGDKTRDKLHKAGVHTFAQLAAMPVDRLAEVTGYSLEVIAEKDWTSEAADLSLQEHADPASGGERPPDRHNFTVELQLETTSDDVLSSRAVHVQSGDQDKWKGWDADRLVRFIERRAIGEPEHDEHDTGAQAGVVPEATRAPEAGSTTPNTDEWSEVGQIIGVTEVRSSALLVPGSARTVGTISLDTAKLPGGLEAATEVNVDVFGRPASIGKMIPLARVKIPLAEAEGHVGRATFDITDPGTDVPVEVVAVLTFRGERRAQSGTPFELASARITLDPT